MCRTFSSLWNLVLLTRHFGDDDIDVVFLESLEALEAVGVLELAVD